MIKHHFYLKFNRNGKQIKLYNEINVNQYLKKEGNLVIQFELNFEIFDSVFTVMS